MVLQLSEGSRVEAREFGQVSVSMIETDGIERSICEQHSICFYPEAPVHSTETWEGKVFPLRAWDHGSVAFIPAGSEMRSIPDHRYRECVIKFSPGVLERAADGLVPLDRLNMTFTDITNSAVFGFARMMQGLSQVPDVGDWPLLIESTTVALAVSTIKRLAEPNAVLNTCPSGLLCDVRMRRVCDFIEENLHRRITLQEMAGVAAMSQYHFCRQFAERAGASPLRYVLKRRVEAAKVRLLKPGSTIADAALACGFSGQSHFTTTFKQFTGSTPGEYLRDLGVPQRDPIGVSQWSKVVAQI